MWSGRRFACRRFPYRATFSATAFPHVGVRRLIRKDSLLDRPKIYCHSPLLQVQDWQGPWSDPMVDYANGHGIPLDMKEEGDNVQP